MRIGVMLQSLHHLGGIGTYTKQIVKHLLAIDKKNEYILIYPSFGKAHKSMGQYKDYANVTEVFSESLVPHGNYWDHFVVPKVANKYGVSLIFNPFESIPLFGKFRKIFVCHNSERFIMPEVFWFSERLTGKLRIKAVMNAADLIISVSHKVASDLIQATGVAKEKLRVIHNAAGEEFKPIRDETRLASIKERYQLPENFLFFVGGIYPQKNFGGLVRAFQSVVGDIPHKLVIAGNTRWKSKEDMNLIDRLGLEDRVQFIGWVSHEDLPVIINLATCFVMPSFHESCSVALLEAMSCGCPVIASNTGGNLEVVDGAAMLIDPKNTSDLGEAILRVIANPDLQRELAQKGLARAGEFSWEKSARETLKVLQEVHAG